jgi:hypothetical protein
MVDQIFVLLLLLFFDLGTPFCPTLRSARSQGCLGQVECAGKYRNEFVLLRRHSHISGGEP